MPIVSSIFLVAALALAVVVGPQTRPWTWGPAMIALGISALAALPTFWKPGRHPTDFATLALGLLAAGWFVWRAWLSPVVEFGHADILLVGGVVAAFTIVRAIGGNITAERILAWGIALVLLANVLVIGKQVLDPSFSPVFNSRASGRMISGFFAHYNEAANFLIAASMMVGAAALFGGKSLPTRIIWIAIALAGIAGVWLTRSRGGILGAAIACGIFAALALMAGKRRKAGWFAPALIAIPVIGLGIGAFLFMGWQQAQEARNTDAAISNLLDNDIRLYLLGIATSCIGLHPWSGGGSRSFSWECFRFWEHSSLGAAGARPELVHNELMQSATDYGIFGTLLLVGFIGTLTISAVIRILFDNKPGQSDKLDAWRIGGLAALAGMLIQSCFSFVFHLLPGIILLGICLGMISAFSREHANPWTIGSRILLGMSAACCTALMFPGWMGTKVTRILWPSYFSKNTIITDEARADALSAAILVWPQSTLYQERAGLYQKAVVNAGASDSIESAERAIIDYGKAAMLNPYDPGLAVNRANLLSQLKRDTEAAEWFGRAIQLQGGLEAGFRGHYSLATHLYQKGLREFHRNEQEMALGDLQGAATHIETAVKKTPAWVIYIEGRNLRISIHESLGTVREASGDRVGALQSYDFAATIPTGNRAHYRAGVMIGKMAVEAWSKRRPSEAMKLFIEARRRVGLAGGQLPEGVNPAQSAEFIAYLDGTIAFLKGAKVEPMK